MSTSVLRVPSRLIAALAGLAMVASMVAIAPLAAAEDGPEVIRVAGENRFDTAAQVAGLTYPDGAEDVIVAAGFNFPDALAASGVGGLVDAPILLVNDVLDQTTQFTLDALEDLDPDIVHIAGGTRAVSAEIQAEIAAAGDWTINRFAGATRFETAALMAEVFDPGDVAGSTAIVATGFVAADSLSAGPLAHFGPHPILLTRADELPEATAEALEDLEVDTVLVLGGPSAVSAGVVAELEALDDVDTVVRAAGANRFETAVEITGFEPFSGGPRIMLATGFGPENVPADALAGGPHGGVFEAELLPINDVRDELPPAIEAYLQSIAGDVETIVVLGGTRAISNAVANAAQAAATPDVPPDPPVAPSFTDAPELVAAQVTDVSDDLDEWTIEFTFDEAVTGVPANGDGFYTLFYDGTALEGDSATVPFSPDPVVEVEFDGDPGDAAFATTASVDEDVVEDADGLENLPGSFGIQDIVVDSFDGPVLEDVALNSANNRVTVTYDDDVTQDTAGSFVLILANGTTRTGQSFVSNDDNEIVVEMQPFTGAQAATAAKLVTVDDAIDEADAWQQFVLTGDGGVDDAPELVAVDVNVADARVEYTFDGAVSVDNIDGFGVNLTDGSTDTTTGAALVAGTVDTVRVEAAQIGGGDYADLVAVVGGWIEADAVSYVGETDGNVLSVVTASAEYAAGETGAPILEEAVYDDGDDEIQLTFDRDVAVPAAVNLLADQIFVSEADGSRYDNEEVEITRDGDDDNVIILSTSNGAVFDEAFAEAGVAISLTFDVQGVGPVSLVVADDTDVPNYQVTRALD